MRQQQFMICDALFLFTFKQIFVFKVDMHMAVISNCVIPENYKATPPTTTLDE